MYIPILDFSWFDDWIPFHFINRSLTIKNCSIDGIKRSFLNMLWNKLEFFGCKFKESILKNSLPAINIIFNEVFFEKSVKILSNFIGKKTETLKIHSYSCKIRNIDRDAFKNARNLINLNLDIELDNYDDYKYDYLKNITFWTYTFLENLTLRIDNLDDKDARHLKNYKKLKKLTLINSNIFEANLNWIPKINNILITFVNQWPNLIYLNLFKNIRYLTVKLFRKIDKNKLFIIPISEKYIKSLHNDIMNINIESNYKNDSCHLRCQSNRNKIRTFYLKNDKKIFLNNINVINCSYRNVGCQFIFDTKKISTPIFTYKSLITSSVNSNKVKMDSLKNSIMLNHCYLDVTIVTLLFDLFIFY